MLEKYLPDAEVTVWTFNPLTPAAREIVQRRFPSVEIVEGALDGNGEPTDSATIAAIERADFFLHGSGPAMLGWRHAEAFERRTGRGFGVFGVTYGLYGIPEKKTLSRARFVFFRDSVSLARAMSDGVHAPIMEWAPDTAFGFNLQDDSRAAGFLAKNHLEDGKFLCCISRYRNTPFWLMPGHASPFDPVKHARNEEKKEADHEPLLAAIIAVIRETPLKILLCPEDETQMEVTRKMLLEKLPADVRAKVVWRENFWLPDEAVSVYRRSAGLFGHEMHSPIMCVAHGIPAIVCRWAEQSSKGFMWSDIGLGEWLFDLDLPDAAARVAPTVLALARDPAGAREKAARAHDLVNCRFEETLRAVSSAATASKAP